MSGPPGPGAALLDDDPFDRALLTHVHPADWVNPVPRERYHLVVIGAGTAGLVTAAAAAGLGATVALIEGHLMGGDCLTVGCVPSKALLSAAHAWHSARAAAAFGGPAASGDGDFAEAMTRMRRLRAQLSPVDSAERFRSLGVDVFLGTARFASPDLIEVGDARLRFRRAVVATGARAAVPPIPGLVESGFLTNETVFTLTERPSRLAVIGGGPIGCELAQAFQRLGCRVTVLTRDAAILPRDDAEATQCVAASLESDGVEIIRKVDVRSVARTQKARVLSLHVDGRDLRLEVDQVLVATGRVPNTDGLGLELAGVRTGPHGVEVDDRLRTSNPSVYAVGDIASAYKFTHAADAQARIVVQNALFFGRARASRLVIPWCTYTSPELAQVGLTELKATERGIPTDIMRVDFSHLDRAVLEGETAGLLKLVLARGTDRILGATLVAAHAGEMIGELALAMTSGLGLAAIGRTLHPYPTQAEAFRKAADQWRKRKLTPTVTRLLTWWFRILT